MDNEELVYRAKCIAQQTVDNIKEELEVYLLNEKGKTVFAREFKREFDKLYIKTIRKWK